MKVSRLSKTNRYGIIKIAFLFLLFVLTNHATSQTANFTGTPTSGYAPLTVKFTDHSVGGIMSWDWSFPGSLSPAKTGKGPHWVVYQYPGTYSVTLVVTDTAMKADTQTRVNYITALEEEPEEPRDFGDAPDVPGDTTKNYHTLLANNGAYHYIKDNIYLGSFVDAEPDGQPNEDATGDDMEGNDEDGVVIPKLFIGDSAEFEVTVVGNGYLNGWIDFNHDGDWGEPDEHIFSAIPLTTGSHTLAADIPDTAEQCSSFARFRYSSEPNLNYFGGADDGEVEDYGIELYHMVYRISEQDSLALVALYNSTDGPNWTNHILWITGPVWIWHGISLTLINSVLRVTGIDLHNNHLVGTIPPEIGDLDQLEYLVLENNELYGPIPPEIGNLNQLKSLDLYYNELSGPIPPEIGNLNLLESLLLMENELTDPIPPEIYTLTNLTHLDLWENNLTGGLSPDIGNLVNLTELMIHDNELSGPIPPEIGNLTDLYVLTLSSNGFTGQIPHELGNLSNLLYLAIGDDGITGPIPNEIWNLSNLTYLALCYSQFSGQVPQQISNLINLQTLHIGGDGFSGPFPIQLTSLLDLDQLILSSNQFSGAIPSQINNLINLEYLTIDKNQFDDLPDMSSMPNLQTVYVNDNQFEFDDIEPNISIPYLNYSPQDSVGTEQKFDLASGQSLNISVSVGGTANQYQWMKDGIDIPGANSNSYHIASLSISDAGRYICKITNTVATELTLYSRTNHIFVDGFITAVKEQDNVPDRFALLQNYPNPFNPKTTIRFDVREPCRVVLKIYNLMGQEVSELVNEEYPSGRYEVNFNATGFSSGIYLYKIRMGNFQRVKKMVILE